LDTLLHVASVYWGQLQTYERDMALAGFGGKEVLARLDEAL
jgi:hypothetical protein